MSKPGRYFTLTCALVLLAGGVFAFVLSRCHKPQISQWHWADRPAVIQPDYTGTVIAPNIAPLNFLVQEQGTYYYVKIHSKQGTPIEIFSRKAKIVIPENPWHSLLNNNTGQPLYFDVFVQTPDSQWVRFETIENTIAAENIDNYIVYRKIYPVHGIWNKIGIYQRSLNNFQERAILKNENYKRGCLNCHTLCNNRTDKMLINIRSAEYGSTALLAEGDVISKIGTKMGYSSWHPSGRLVVYSVNKVRQFFHSAANEVRDVLDLDSLLAYYLTDNKVVKTAPNLSKKDRLETYPAWSPDGHYLYFCSAAMLWADQNKLPPQDFEKVRYDLLRISYDLDNDRWGQIETVLSSDNTGQSILEPRISPDGRWLLFCMCDYGCFPVYRQSSDLYLLDIETARATGEYRYRRLDINSNQSESWHSWSSNSRWIAFSSKRDYGVFTRLYISYIDQAGRVYKPILLPQRDPIFYDRCLQAYNTPELATEPVRFTGGKLARIVRAPQKIEVDMPITMATPQATGQPAAVPWLTERE